MCDNFLGVVLRDQHNKCTTPWLFAIVYQEQPFMFMTFTFKLKIWWSLMRVLNFRSIGSMIQPEECNRMNISFGQHFSHLISQISQVTKHDQADWPNGTSS